MTNTSSKTLQSPINHLSYKIQTYAWGRPASESLVFSLAKDLLSSLPERVIEQNDSFEMMRRKVEDSQCPYAELWMGTHPNGPSLVIRQNDDHNQGVLTLHEYLKRKNIHNGDLPFLFKVLSVNQALSIQAHPNKQRAEILHREDPEHYKDPNHKPEMTVALTQFEMLCCFKKKIQVPEELKEPLGLKSCTIEDRVILRDSFTKLMHMESKQVKPLLDQLIDRITRRKDNQHTPEEKLVLRLNEVYPGDVGVFSPYFMNHVILQPGESVYLAPNEPHSYLYGDCVECMTCSDNVVRAGLTPKYRDVSTLTQMLSYKMDYLKDLKHGTGKVIANHIRAFLPPVQSDEFKIIKVDLPSGEETQWQIEDVSIAIVISGSARLRVLSKEEQKEEEIHEHSVDVKKGDCLVIDPNTHIRVDNESGEGFLVFLASSK